VILEQLDPEQRTVALAQGQPLVVIAGPGTGKTRALTSRIAYGAAVGAIDPRATLAVTFTTRAAAELRTRLAQLGVAGPQARTFHSAALAQARYFWPLVYGVNLPRLVEAPERLIRELLPRFGLAGTYLARDLAHEIAWTKHSNVVPERYATLAPAAGRQVDGVSWAQTADLITEYELLKQGYGLIDFDDILLCAAAVLEDSEEAARQMARRYRHLLVDEFQDVSPIQARLTQLWRGPHEDLTAVGDPAQTIHGFAGAESRYLTDFARWQRHTQSLRLSRNYRSSPQIVTMANQLMRPFGGVDLQAQQAAGPAVEVAQARSNEAEAWAVVEWLADRATDGLPWSDMAVLYRSHAQAAAVTTALAERNIPYHVVAAGTGDEERVRPGPLPTSAGAVTCCTLHSAKGREWEAVGIVGLAEGLVPHIRAIRPAEVAEERRLLYVGLTRARRYLRLSWAGEAAGGRGQPSRFLHEAQAL
jgi:DNA helicase-2/ATP-dependent DNA helicase PcrA